MTAGRQAISTTKNWCTPPEILASVRAQFGGTIALDPCSNEDALVDAQVEYRLPAHDGLVESWHYPTIFVNPPYGSDKQRGTRIADWFTRMRLAAAAGSEVIALVPVATNTAHWKRDVFPHAAAICFLAQPRVRFYLAGVPDPKGAPMACALIYWGPNVTAFKQNFVRHGVVVPLRDAAQQV